MSDHSDVFIDVKHAVTIAKDWVKDILSEENLTDIGLEEVEFDDSDETWKITIGFSRPWNTPRTSAMNMITGNPATPLPKKRAYRIIAIHGISGVVLSMKRFDAVDNDP